MILSKSLKHGWYYYYKLHKETLDELDTNGYTELKSFLLKVRQRENRPEPRFTEGPRSSQTELPLDIPTESTDHMVCDLASIGLESDYYKDRHMNVQMFMLAYDTQTVAMEIPVWFKSPPESIPGSEYLTGHIDLLRIEDDTIWVWDYKPKAHLEENATTQTLLYALMLSDCTDIPLSHFKCGYFDQQNAYIFEPKGVTNKLTERLTHQT